MLAHTDSFEFLCSATGTFNASVMIDGRHVLNSPVRLCFRSTRPVISSCQLGGRGLKWALIGEPAKIGIRLFDQFGNEAAPGEQYRRAFKVGFQLIKDQAHSTNASNDETVTQEVDGTWVGASEYEFTYKAQTTGAHQLHLFCTGLLGGADGADATAEGAAASSQPKKNGASAKQLSVSTKANENDTAASAGVGKRKALIPFPGSPFKMNVENAGATDLKGSAFKTAEVAPQDYTVIR